MQDDDILSNSNFFKEFSAFVLDVSTLGSDTEDRGYPEADSGDRSYLDVFDNITVTRFVIVTVLFFLVQILVRLYQYSLRLASFWESRGDAALMARSFTKTKTERFDDLVRALAPDSYDFKPSPRSPLDWLRARNET